MPLANGPLFGVWQFPTRYVFLFGNSARIFSQCTLPYKAVVSLVQLFTSLAQVGWRIRGIPSSLALLPRSVGVKLIFVPLLSPIWTQPLCFITFFSMCLRSSPPSNDHFFGMILWSMWRRRNVKVWDNVSKDISRVIERVSQVLCDWKVACIPADMPPGLPPPILRHTWYKPLQVSSNVTWIQGSMLLKVLPISVLV